MRQSQCCCGSQCWGQQEGGCMWPCNSARKASVLSVHLFWVEAIPPGFLAGTPLWRPGLAMTPHPKKAVGAEGHHVVQASPASVRTASEHEGCRQDQFIGFSSEEISFGGTSYLAEDRSLARDFFSLAQTHLTLSLTSCSPFCAWSQQDYSCSRGWGWRASGAVGRPLPLLLVKVCLLYKHQR